ncbi:hypothetical protein PC123_g10592 [Phytophthora cactorum]|nr:hypothetical protein PC123_g10592 [Phytophthora cactorum]
MLATDRWRPGGFRAEVPCPSIVRDYHRWMGGVDVHDQLRLQRYSLQQQTKYKKYYKALFLGLVDIANVNAYIVYREAQRKREGKADIHAEFLMQLQAEMLDMKKDDFAQRPPPDDEGESIPRSLSADHVPRENLDYQIVNDNASAVNGNARSARTESAASESVKPANNMCRTYLCSKVWPHTKTNTLTCHQIWHFQWNNGTNRPRPRCGRDIQRHKASSGAGKRKRHRRSLSGQDNDNAAETTEREDTADEHAAEDTAADQHADEE